MGSRAQLNVDVVVDIVVELLAEERGRDAAELRAELVEAGPELPIDSLLIVEILTRIQDRCGVRIPADADAARSMRSLYAFAGTVIAAGAANNQVAEGAGEHVVG
jgi:acyl carrier protein